MTAIAAAFAVALTGQAARADRVEVATDCGSLENAAYGPFDYRRVGKQSRDLVEKVHFTRGVENLSRQATGPFGWDIGYTLRAFPNHHRALLAMQNLVAKEKRNPALDAIYTIECYYDRAIRFRPDDNVVRLLYVNFLISQGKADAAQQHLDYVVRVAAEEPFTQFNAGMLFFDMKSYERALEQAHKAMAMGFENPKLKERLVSVSRWAEPAAAAAAPAASAASAP